MMISAKDPLPNEQRYARPTRLVIDEQEECYTSDRQIINFFGTPMHMPTDEPPSLVGKTPKLLHSQNLDFSQAIVTSGQVTPLQLQGMKLKTKNQPTTTLTASGSQSKRSLMMEKIVSQKRIILQKKFSSPGYKL